MSVSSEKHSPLEQFEISPFIHLKPGGIDLSFTNSSLSMIITVAFITMFLTFSVNTRSIVPSRLQLLSELCYNFVALLLKDTVGDEGRKYFPFVFTVFMFVGVTVLGFAKHGLHFFSFFVIPGLPWYMLPLLIPIEVISYLSRPISLSVRLFANMLAGHTLLKVFAGFVISLGVAGFLPLAFIVALTGLEILIAFLQAYVFAILTCIYINDALHLH